MVCRDFILPESANYVYFYPFFFLRNLFYLILCGQAMMLFSKHIPKHEYGDKLKLMIPNMHLLAMYQLNREIFVRLEVILVELLSFGPFIELYILFYSRNSFQDTGVELLYSVRMLRNAAAHNNCLINQMRAPFSRSVSPTYELRNRINKLSSLSPEKVKERLQHPTIHDFLALLILYDSIVPEPTRTKGLSETKVLFDERMPQNKDYYRKQQGLISSYSFVKEIVDKITAISD